VDASQNDDGEPSVERRERKEWSVQMKDSNDISCFDSETLLLFLDREESK